MSRSPQVTSPPDAAMAAIHTLFNLITTALFLPFVKPFARLVELDILNAYERVRAYYLNIAETLAGGKGG